METSSIRLGSIRGVPVGASWSLLVVALVLGAGLAESRYPSLHSGYSSSAYWVAGGITVLAFFASILAHEIGHALVARARGLEVDGITLWFLGGVTRMHGEIDGPGADAGIAAIGPITSGALGGVFYLLAHTAETAGADPLAVAVLEWLALINVALAVFNALPAAPLDGGSVLAAAVWWRTGDRARGREVATTWGQVLGVGLVAYGLWALVVDESDSGLWMLLVGWFIFQAARSERPRPAHQMSPTSAVPFAQLVNADPPTVDSTATIDEVVALLGSVGQHTAFAVRDPDGAVRQVALLEDLRTVDHGARARTPIGVIAVPIADQLRVWDSDSWDDVRERVADHPTRAIVVYASDMHLVGIVTPTDVRRWVAARPPNQSDATAG